MSSFPTSSFPHLQPSCRPLSHSIPVCLTTCILGHVGTATETYLPEIVSTTVFSTSSQEVWSGCKAVNLNPCIFLWLKRWANTWGSSLISPLPMALQWPAWHWNARKKCMLPRESIPATTVASQQATLVEAPSGNCKKTQPCTTKRPRRLAYAV